MSVLTEVEAVVVAGGRGTRMGGVDKPTLTVGGSRLIDTAIAAVTGCARVTVVGPHRAELPPHIVQVHETPEGSGPVAALAAAEPTADYVVVLAADLPFVTAETVTAVLEALRSDPEADAAFAVDGTGRLQYLLSVWRGPALDAALRALGPNHAGHPMKALVPPKYTTIPVAETGDCDTPDELRHARMQRPDPRAAATPDQARTALRAAQHLLPARTVRTSDAAGTTLAEAAVAAEALPPVPVSAMDGYAVAGDGPWELRTEIRRAGSDLDFRLGTGQAARIATGAHLPDGATAVIRDEFVDITDGRLVRRPNTPVRNDARPRGEDWQPGTILATPGTPVTPAVMSAAASSELPHLTVRGPLRVHVVITGDEIRRDGPLRPGQTRDSLGPVLPSFVRWCGATPVSEAHLRDTADAFDDLLRHTTDVDALVIVGATGGGAADQLRAALTRSGAHTVVERVRCKPGGSQVAAVLPDGRAVLGLPGNPVAAVATLLLTLPAIADGRTGRTPRRRILVPLANASDVSGDIARLLPAYSSEDGTWRCDNTVRTAHLAGLIDRAAIAVVPPEATDGDLVELLLLPH